MTNNNCKNKDVDDDEIIQQIVKLRERGRKLGLSDEEIYQHFDHSWSSRLMRKYFPTLQRQRVRLSVTLRRKVPFSSVLITKKAFVALLAICVAVAFNLDDKLKTSIHSKQCLLSNCPLLQELFRPYFPCQICQNLSRVPEVTNISKEEFAREYAYTGIPVLVKGAVKNWSAVGNFSFQFFKDLYLNDPEGLAIIEEDCQFFRYNTDFESLSEVFNMSDDRATFKEGEKPWYIGWSNCDPDIGKKIREMYQFPYFLPKSSENSPTDWIFMGGPGNGAHTHIDNVELPSWQAQVSGKKTWRIFAGADCLGVCKEIEVTVEKGDIFVLDTNLWFHSTYIHPGEISITVGAEFS